MTEIDGFESRPDSEILKNLQKGNFQDELPHLRRRILWNPEDVGPCYLLALASDGLSDRTAERAWMERALTLAPNQAHLRTSFGLSRLRDHDVEGAYAAFNRALLHSPNFAAARYNRALIELEGMHFSRGWSDYEWRFSYDAAPGVWRDFPSPVWDGVSPVDGKLLIWSEQALSSQILFSSTFGEIDHPGGLMIEVTPELVPLLRRALPRAQIVEATDPPHPRLLADDIGAQIPMGRLCGMRRKTLADFAQAKIGFLQADSERAIDLMLDLGVAGQKTIGLAWRISSRGGSGVSLEGLKPLLSTPGVNWVSLEGEDALAEINAFEAETNIRIRTDHGIDTTGDLDGLGALISACDLVIGVDSPAVHLAGALGRSVWTMLPSRGAARWFWFSRHHPRPQKISRWYPSMRLAWKKDNESHPVYMERIADLLRGAINAAEPAD
jgi:hypothetical protein